MSQPPSQETPPDDLLQAYHRASAHERSVPSAQVRAAILARSKQPGVLWNNAAEGHDVAEHPIASGRPAANDSHWKWKAAASVGAAGLVGMLAWQTYLTPRHGAAPTPAGFSTDQAVPPNAPASAASPAAPSPAPPAAAPPTTSATFGARPAVVPEETLQPSGEGPRSYAADANRGEAPRAALQSMNAKAARSAAFALTPRREQIMATLRAALPQLFTWPAATATVRVALVLNGDGTVYKIAREQAAAVADQADATSQIRQALGVRADELGAPAQFVTIDPSANQPNSIVVAVGVRGNER
jgi:hypothetical protein